MVGNSVKSFIAATLMIAVALGAGAAHGAVLVNEHFEGYGPTQLNWAGSSDLTVVRGTVDYILEPDFGLSTPFGRGLVDLDGSSGHGGRLNTALFSFNAGDTVIFELDASGNQRNGSPDTMSYGLIFNGLVGIDQVIARLPGFNFGPDGPFLASGLLSSVNLAADAPWGHYYYQFVTYTSGSLYATIDTGSADNVGPLIDNVRLRIHAVVPEPQTWALMITGFGLMGVALRRRRYMGRLGQKAPDLRIVRAC